MTKAIRKTIFWIAITFIGLTLFTLTIGQLLPYEFADYKLQHKFYDIIIQGLPIAVLLTLFMTIKRDNSKIKNWTWGSLTVLTAILCFVGQLIMLFTFGFGAWTTLRTVYVHKTENREIKEQLYDVGAFGYGGRRTVETKPFLKYWIQPTQIDTLKMEKKQWVFVNRQGDIKSP